MFTFIECVKRNSAGYCSYDTSGGAKVFGHPLVCMLMLTKLEEMGRNGHEKRGQEWRRSWGGIKQVWDEKRRSCFCYTRTYQRGVYDGDNEVTIRKYMAFPFLLLFLFRSLETIIVDKPFYVVIRIRHTDQSFSSQQGGRLQKVVRDWAQHIPARRRFPYRCEESISPLKRSSIVPANFWFP